MSQWESQIRTNLEAPEYGKVLDHAVASAPGLLAAGLVNVRYEEGSLRVPHGKIAPERDLGHLVQLSRGLFPTAARANLPDTYAVAFAELMPVESAHWTTRSERLFAHRMGDVVLLISVSSTLKLGPALVVVGEAIKALRTGASRGNGVDHVGAALEEMNDVLGAGSLDPRAGVFGEIYRRAYGPSEFAFDDAMAVVVGQFFSPEAVPVPVVFRTPSGERLEVMHAQITSTSHVRGWWTVPFDSEHLVFVLSDRQTVPQGLVVTIANRATEETVRVWADGLLAWGIDAILEPFPKTQREFLAIVEELRQLDENDLIARLRVGGFTNYSMGEGENIQRCQECIYYHPHRKWCDLPELPIPVEPHWWCRLWKL